MMFRIGFVTMCLCFYGCLLEVNAQLVNIAKDKPVTGFPFIKGNPFSNIVDGDDETLWYLPDAVTSKYVEIDLSGEFVVDRILLKYYKGIEDIKITLYNKGSITEVFKGTIPEKHLITFAPKKATAIRVEFFKKPKVHSAKPSIYVGEIEVYAYQPQPVMVNQTGYNLMGVKRFTAPLAKDGSPFVVKDTEGRELYKGIVTRALGDFSAFKPDLPGPYYIEVRGTETGRSFPFNIEPYLLERASYNPALAFMNDTRCWYGCADELAPNANGTGCPFLGVAWRDSHQFSFEIPVLLSMYFANPEAFSRERMPDTGVYSGLRKKLPAETPEVVKMVYWAVDIYLRGKVNHTLLKGQLAWFVYAYPHLSEYIPRSVYQEAVDYLFTVWGNPEKDRWSFHDVDHSADLFQTYKIIGSGKGQLPPGFSITPNLMMYEVAKREKRADADKFFRVAYDQTAWIIANLDWNDPATTKGQRMNEYVTLDALSYFLKQYPDRAPKGLAKKIASWADIAIKRSDNIWDYRMYSERKWTIPDVLYPNDPKFNPNGSFNEVGNIAAFPVPALAAAWSLEKQGNRAKDVTRLREMAAAHTDHMFGRNPVGRHFSYDAITDFEGADLGWFREWDGGAGMLQTVRGVLDGSVKEASYPYNPYGGDVGHSEGWVTFNTAWIMALAYQAADVTRVELYDLTQEKTIQSIARKGQLRVRLYAPLNLDPSKKEMAKVTVRNLSNGKSTPVELQEIALNGLYFEGILDVSKLPIDVKKGNKLTISYGLEHFEKSATCKVD
ncbi:MAG: hypothetical protein WC623_10220 [Pedobacter sp.]|uniref:hypothetical protein n=1 Tax=Pedobacter sp. TaxID=1411316 RepID=UPI0035674EFB